MSDSDTGTPCNPLYTLSQTVEYDQGIDVVSLASGTDPEANDIDKLDANGSTAKNVSKPSEDTATELIDDDSNYSTCLPSSPRTVSVPQLPHCDCPEKIIIAIDINSEMDKPTFRAKAGTLYTSLSLIKKTIAMFVKAKAVINPQNEFAIVTLAEKAEWLCDFTNEVKEVLYILDILQCPQENTVSLNEEDDTFDIEYLYNIIYQNTDLPVVEGDQKFLPPPYIVRLLLVYGRSHCLPSISQSEPRDKLNDCPYFYMDCIYLHDPLTQESQNMCEDIYNQLISLDMKGLSYILEVSKNPTKVYDSVAKLLSHPLQRPIQSEASYTLSHERSSDI